MKISESNESLFYLNPTTTAATKIYIEGVNKTISQSFIYELNVPIAISIKANMRYKLPISNEFKFTITVADWDSDADEIIDLKPGSGELALVSAPITTYSAPYFKSDVRLSVAAIAADKSFVSIVRITDRSSGTMYELTVYYENTVPLAEYYPKINLKP